MLSDGKDKKSWGLCNQYFKVLWSMFPLALLFCYVEDKIGR